MNEEEPGFFDGEDPIPCDWEDGWCNEPASHYIVEYCDDPDCADDHAMRYCLRHYVIALGLMVDHLDRCPSMRKASTPERRRQVMLEHVAAFGAMHDGGTNSDARSVARPGAYDGMIVTEGTSAEELDAWLRSLKLSYWNLGVRRFSRSRDAAMWLQELRFDAYRDRPYRYRRYDPVPDTVEWTASGNRAIEGLDLIRPHLATRRGPDGGIAYSYTCDSMRAGEMDECGKFTSDEADAVPGSFAIVETRTDTVLPVCVGSWLQWKVTFPDESRLTVRDRAAFLRSMAPYAEYADASEPLDVRRALAHARALEHRLRLMGGEGSEA